ncbi:MAG: DUF1080 domain-containing protein [Planctomycetota bacterium]
MLNKCLFGCLLILHASSARCEVSHEEGFMQLFDGKSLDGWIGDGKQFFDVADGVMACQQGCHGKLVTQQEYRDFVLRFEFKLTVGANNGLAIRAPLEGDAAYAGIELQILDNTADKYQNLKDYQFHGSAYGIAAAKRGALKPVGKWNTQEVVCQGRTIKVTLNDIIILDIDLDKAAPDDKTIDGEDHPGLKRHQGHVGFLCHNDRVYFRNVRVKEMQSLVAE